MCASRRGMAGRVARWRWLTFAMAIAALALTAPARAERPHGHAEVTVSKTQQPASTISADNWRRAERGRDLPNVRIVGSIPQPAANLVASRLAHVPERVVQRTDALGMRATLFSGRMTDVWGARSLRGEHPRGWPEGATWDTVPGSGGRSGFFANPNRELTGRGHGSTSLALHEYGHVVDGAMGGDKQSLSTRPGWKDVAWREYRAANPTDHYAGSYAEEWFAESFARYTKSQPSNDELAHAYPETYHFLSRELGPARFDAPKPDAHPPAAASPPATPPLSSSTPSTSTSPSPSAPLSSSPTRH